MRKEITLLAGFALLFAVADPLHAQTGCVNSPENPTIVLALVGFAGAFLGSARRGIKARREHK